MILQELKRYIEEKGCATQQELAKQFHLSTDGVDVMLSVWIKKGNISKLVDVNKHNQVTRVRYSLSGDKGLSLTVTM